MAFKIKVAKVMVMLFKSLEERENAGAKQSANSISCGGKQPRINTAALMTDTESTPATELAEPKAAGESYEPTPIDRTQLRKLRKSLRLTQSELANLLGIHRTYLVLIENGKKHPSPRLERSIIEFMDKAKTQSINPPTEFGRNLAGGTNAVFAEVPARRIPVVSWASAGLAKDYEDLRNHIDELVETDCKDSNAFAVIIEGDSMETKFYAGDRVVLAPLMEPRNGDPVVARLADGRVLFKYFFRTGPEGSLVRLTSENPNYAAIEVPKGEVEFAYPAWEIKRRIRR